jgi:hypothetical protein
MTDSLYAILAYVLNLGLLLGYGQAVWRASRRRKRP